MSRAKRVVWSLFLGSNLLSLLLQSTAWAVNPALNCQNPKIRASVERLLSYRSRNIEKARALVNNIRAHETAGLETLIAETEASFRHEPSRQVASSLGKSSFYLEQTVKNGRGQMTLDDIESRHAALRGQIREKMTRILERKRAARDVTEYLRANIHGRRLADQALQKLSSLCQQADFVEKSMAEWSKARAAQVAAEASAPAETQNGERYSYETNWTNPAGFGDQNPAPPAQPLPPVEVSANGPIPLPTQPGSAPISPGLANPVERNVF